MVFTSIDFVLFFAVVYALYRVLPHRAQNVMLLAASYYFYGSWDWRFLGLLIGSTVVDYFVGRYLGPNRSPSKRRLALILSLVFNLGMLGFFKYFDFFAESFAALAGTFGWHVDTLTLRIVLPIGISFYTFMTISYVIDVYRREIVPTTHPLDFALFVAYFPHLVAGPILRASLLLPQIEKPRTVTKEHVVRGLWLIGWGCFQKMFVADNLAPLVDTVFGPSAAPTGADVLVASWAFAFQIFGDFAGYSNIARGVSRMMGIELNVNFRFPYFVISPQEFWRHWHISLSTWLRDYLYIPLGGNRHGAWRTHRNLMITMALGGLWHGAAWTFVIWGLYQGALLVAGHSLAGFGDRNGVVIPPGLNLKRLALGSVMFLATCYGWLIFRAESFSQLSSFTALLFTNFRVTATTIDSLLIPFLQVVAPLLLVHIYQARYDDEDAPLRLPMGVRYALYAAVFYCVLLWGDFSGAQFIYFQF
ncbi:MAG TPA: MBOAT family O-acyltransferase [Vicinamibacterales bacterium]|nr:MBOAT family O-acyltransferase [Vicinamibacterales bacterium]